MVIFIIGCVIFTLLMGVVSYLMLSRRYVKRFYISLTCFYLMTILQLLYFFFGKNGQRAVMNIQFFGICADARKVIFNILKFDSIRVVRAFLFQNPISYHFYIKTALSFPYFKIEYWKLFITITFRVNCI